LNTIKDADVIAVLDEGVVVESGNYAQLLSNGGAFKDLMSNQTA
jgi:ABC-type multidrug transport system fused ATPase/permease subunit